MSFALECVGLARRFGRLEALQPLHLTLPSGAVFGLFGPNGAGKSTALRLLLGLDRPSSGRASVLGIDTQSLRPKDRTRLGYATENQSLPEDYTLARLLAFSRPFYPRWDRSLEHTLLTRLQLPLDRPLRTFSRGMLMKVALLTAVAYRPEVLFLDEPYSGLDPSVRDELTAVLLEIGSQHEWTIVLSTHDLSEVEGFIDHAGFLHAGSLSFAESVATLRARFRRLEFDFAPDGPPPRPALPSSWKKWETSGPLARVIETQFSPQAEADYRSLFPHAACNALPLSLREIYLALQPRTSSHP